MKKWLVAFEFNQCLVLLCDQNSFGWSKIVLVWPNWFGLDHINLVTTIMIWSRPKWIWSKLWFSTKMNHNLDLTNSFWSWPFHFGRDQIIMVRPKTFWTNQNCLGHIEGQGTISRYFWKIQTLLWLRGPDTSNHPRKLHDHLISLLVSEDTVFLGEFSYLLCF